MRKLRGLYSVLVCIMIVATAFLLVVETECVSADPPRKIHVDADYQDHELDETHKRTITEGVEAANPFDMIVIHRKDSWPFAYEENIIINKPLTISGEGPHASYVEGKSQDIPVFWVKALGVTIEDLTILRGGEGIYCDYQAGVKILHNDIIGNTNSGILVLACNQVEISLNKIKHNQQDGILISKSENVKITGNMIDENWYNGIYIYDSNDVAILGNPSISENGIHNGKNSKGNLGQAHGIQVVDSADVTISFNAWIYDNHHVGIRIYGTSNSIQVTDNTILNSWDDGIRLESYLQSNPNFPKDVLINNNKILTGDEVGVHIINGMNIYVDNNEVYLNDNGGIYVRYTSGDGIVIIRNHVYKNRDPLISNPLKEHGIFIHSIKRVSVSENIIHDNGGDGIHSEWSVNLNVLNNKISSNEEEGIEFINTYSALISGNEIKLNDENGILLDRCYLISVNANPDITKNGIKNGEGNMGPLLDSHGILIKSCDNVKITNNPNIINNHNTAIYILEDSTFITITNNGITDSLGRGIRGEKSSNLLIQNNNIKNQNGGIALEECKGTNGRIEISGNIVINHAYRGIALVSCTDLIISQNRIQSSGWEGIYIHDCIKVDILSNPAITGNDIGIRISHYSSEITIFDNVIKDSTQDGILCKFQPYNRYGNDPDWPNNIKILDNYISRSGHEQIHFYSGSQNTIMGNTIVNGDMAGIIFDTECGTDNQVVNNVITRNGIVGPKWKSGVMLCSAYPILVKENHIIENDGEGIWIHCDLGTYDYNTGHIIEGNTIAYNGLEGICTKGHPTNHNDIIGNHIYDNGKDGIYIIGSHNNEIRKNEIYNTGGGKDQQYGIHLKDCHENKIVSRNKIHGNLKSGIYLDNSYENIIARNEIYKNRENGIYFKDSYDNKILFATKSYENDKAGCYLENSWNNELLYENKMYNNGQHGLYLKNSNDNDIGQNRIYGNTEDGILLDNSNENKIEGNRIYNQENGIHIKGSSTNNKIQNDNEIHINTIGILFKNSKQTNLLKGNKIHGNHQYGIHLDESSNIEITEGNQIYDNYMGLFLEKSDGNIIGKNVIENKKSGGQMYGIYLKESNNNKISENRISDQTAIGIFMEKCEKDNELESNNVEGNIVYGIYLKESDKHDLIENTVNDNYLAGIALRESKYNCFEKNYVGENFVGIELKEQSDNNIFEENTISKSKECGILLDDSNDNEILENHISENKKYGVSLYNSNNNVVQDNTVSDNNMDGIHLLESDQNGIFGNYVMGNNGDGIKYNTSDRNTAHCNIVISNQDDAFDLYRSNSNAIYDNEVLYNSGAGWYLIESMGNGISENNNVYNGKGQVVDTNPSENPYSLNYWLPGADTAYKDIDGDFIGDVGVIPYPSSNYDYSPYVVPIAHTDPPRLNIFLVPTIIPEPPIDIPSPGNETYPCDPLNNTTNLTGQLNEVLGDLRIIFEESGNIDGEYDKLNDFLENINEELKEIVKQIENFNVNEQSENLNEQLDIINKQLENIINQQSNIVNQVQGLNEQLESFIQQLENIKLQLENIDLQLENINMQLVNLNGQSGDSSRLSENDFSQLEDVDGQLWFSIKLGDSVKITPEIFIEYYETRNKLALELHTFSWDLGDGNTSTDSVVTHTYSAPGEYLVSCYTEDKYGRSDTAEIWIRVIE